MKGHSGQGIKIYRNYKLGISLFDDVIKYGPFVVEELIEQGDELAVIHKESINTVRLVTFKVKNNVHIIGGALRMGVGASTVDNAGAGESMLLLIQMRALLIVWLVIILIITIVFIQIRAAR